MTDKKINTIPLSSVVSGELIQLSNVNDATFASEAMGKGIGIKPNDNQIYAPIDGEITTIFPTKHAIGITDESGIEILIHIGIDTVELNGQFFELDVQEGDRVSKGQKLVQVDFAGINEAGYDTTVMVIITNTNEFLDVIPSTNKKVTTNDLTMNIVLS